MYLHNQSVFIPPDLTMEILEEKLKSAYGVIRESKYNYLNITLFENINLMSFDYLPYRDMNSVCSGYALPSLCFSVMPTCRSPEQTNHHYFANKAAFDATIRHAKKQKSRVRSSQRKKAVTIPTTTEKLTVYFHGAVTPRSGTSFSGNIVTETIPTERKRRGLNDGSERRKYPPTRNTENLRRICRDDCELLEHELCQKEYAIAKRHPTIGQSLSLEECHDVPDDIDCLKLGIAIDVNPDHDCYWDNGIDYRGTSSVSDTGTTCYKWAKLMRDISDYSELAGHNYCRNPGGAQNAPWCFVDRAKTVEICKIPKCADKMWFYIIISFIGIATFIMLFVIVLCCKKFRKPTVANIQNVRFLTLK
jgi:receptor tyrosine kinase-like orphan receptor 1